MQADKAGVSRLLKTARGQIDGILKMIEEDRYCIDVSNQLLATQSILRKANQQIIRSHMEHCVADAFSSGNHPQEKIEEILNVMDKMSR